MRQSPSIVVAVPAWVSEGTREVLPRLRDAEDSDKTNGVS